MEHLETRIADFLAECYLPHCKPEDFRDCCELAEMRFSPEEVGHAIDALDEAFDAMFEEDDDCNDNTKNRHLYL